MLFKRVPFASTLCANSYSQLLSCFSLVVIVKGGSSEYGGNELNFLYPRILFSTAANTRQSRDILADGENLIKSKGYCCPDNSP